MIGSFVESGPGSSEHEQVSCSMPGQYHTCRCLGGLEHEQVPCRIQCKYITCRCPGSRVNIIPADALVAWSMIRYHVGSNANNIPADALVESRHKEVSCRIAGQYYTCRCPGRSERKQVSCRTPGQYHTCRFPVCSEQV